MKIIYQIKDCYEGLLSAVFESFLQKQKVEKVVTSSEEQNLFEQVFCIEIDKEKANRVDKKIKKILSPYNYHEVKISILSGLENKYTIIFNYLVKVINENRDISENFADSDMYLYNILLKKIHLERHRFLGYIRFSKTSSGVYYAKYSPDNNITSLIFSHFIKRFSIQPFIIHDTKRNIFALHSGSKNIIVEGEFDLNILGNTSDNFASLFKTYYNSVTIKERANRKLMLTYLPLRYNKYLVEKDELV